MHVALQHLLWLKAVRFMGRGEKYLQISISCVSSVYLKRLTYTHSGHTGIKEQWIQESTQSQVTRKAQGPPRPQHTIPCNTRQYHAILQGIARPTRPHHTTAANQSPSMRDNSGYKKEAKSSFIFQVILRRPSFIGLVCFYHISLGATSN